MNASPPDRQKNGRSRDRNINLLKYYGIGAAKAEARRPLDIDGDTFEPNKYFARLLKEKSLNGLVKRDNELVTEIREIDGDMKTLVYENYSKFISATDTIRKMKSNVESMESEMANLNGNMNGISQQCTEIIDALGPNRDKIRRLTNVHNLLKRLQFIFDLPNRLNRCLSTGQYAQAVKYYSRATRLLNHYQHLSAFKGIERDCDTIMGKIKTKIWEDARNPESSLDKVTSSMKLLQVLQEDPRKLWKEYIQVQVACLDNITNKKYDTIEELDSNCLVFLNNTVEQFETLFLTVLTNEEEVDKVKSLDDNDIREAKSDLVQAMIPHVDRFFEKVSGYISLPSVMDRDQLLSQIRVLSGLRESLSTHGQALARVMGTTERMNELTANWEGTLIDGLMSTTTEKMKERLNRLDEFKLNSLQGIAEYRDALGEFIIETDTWLVQHIQNSCLEPLHDLMTVATSTKTDGGQSQFTIRVRESLRKMWQDVLEIIADTNEIDRSAPKLIVGSRLCYDLAEQGIPQIYANVSKSLNSSEGVMDQIIGADAQVMVDQFTRKGQSLLDEETMEEGYTLSSSIEKEYLAPHRAIDAPTQVSKVWQIMFDRVNYLEQLMESVYPQPTSPDIGAETSDTEYELRFGSGSATGGGTGGEGLYTRPTQSSHSLTTASSETPGEPSGLGIMPKFGYDMTVNMMSNIDKLFADRIDIYRHVEPTPLGVCTGLLRILLKAFHETVRQMRLKQNDYQQLQIDSEYLRLVLWSYTNQKDNKWMSNMLQEIVSSAYMRCEIPTPMDSEELEMILSKYMPNNNNQTI
ncbi:exocyst complex component Sec5-domain-containing protein [Phascolomyces articulosus]|uniref:Vacuolar protein sorting-associated protein 51 homolog n=1 Tax=Phascolomyces articulosus TaxID=60185 RepID=A0AAD5PGU2_9FUNG|nr:exocyst complex component Sec5-domain-containing protein [Phascolomyces articulosus]